MNIIECTQGSPEWLEIRSHHFTASEAPAMIGNSKYKTRAQLLHEKFTGITEEVTDSKQRLFDAGHAAEATARPLVEAIIGQDLYPATATNEIEGLPLLASFDGLPMDESIVWENKLENESLIAMLEQGDLSDTYWPQVEQQLLVSGASQALFTICDGEKITGSLWYQSVPERRQKLIDGWHQFAQDLANYVPPVEQPKPIAAPIAELPALTVELVGQVTNTNLAEWQGVVTYRIQAINTDLKTDQDFADAENMVKFLENGEKTLELVKAQALSQTSTIDELFRAIDNIKAEMRTKRLELGRTVEAKKQSIRNEIEQEGQKELAAYVAELSARVGGYLPIIKADFFGRMKGKRTVATLRDAMETALAGGKIDADRFAKLIEQNLAFAKPYQDEFGETLFYDLKHIVTKEPEAFAAIVKLRVSEHRQKLEAEAQAKADAIAKEKAEAEAKAIADAAQKEADERNRIAAEEIRKLDSERVAAEPISKQALQVAAIEPANDAGPTIKLGEICTKLGFNVTADFLDQLGVPAKTEKNAKLYPANKFPTICRLISDHVLALAFKKAA